MDDGLRELGDLTIDLADKDISGETDLELTDDLRPTGLGLGEYDLMDDGLLDLDTDLDDEFLDKNLSRNSESVTQSLGVSSQSPFSSIEELLDTVKTP